MLEPTPLLRLQQPEPVALSPLPAKLTLLPVIFRLFWLPSSSGQPAFFFLGASSRSVLCIISITGPNFSHLVTRCSNPPYHISEMGPSVGRISLLKFRFDQKLEMSAPILVKSTIESSVTQAVHSLGLLYLTINISKSTLLL